MTVTPADKERLLAKFNGNPPVDAASIRQFESEAGLRLPEDYAKLKLLFRSVWRRHMR